MLPPRTKSTAMNIIPKMTVSGGRVGIPKLGLLSRTLGFNMNLGHHGFNYLTSSGPHFVSAFKTYAICNVVLFGLVVCRNGYLSVNHRG